MLGEISEQTFFPIFRASRSIGENCYFSKFRFAFLSELHKLHIFSFLNLSY